LVRIRSEVSIYKMSHKKKTRFDDGGNMIGYSDRLESDRKPRFRADETGDKVTV
jgi:hypothetical protein